MRITQAFGVGGGRKLHGSLKRPKIIVIFLAICQK